MTKGFIASSAIHGALTPLALGRNGKWTNWDNEILLQSSYLLLHADIQVIPPPDQHTGALGLYGEVVKHFPWLKITARPTGDASNSVKDWLNNHPDAFNAAWIKAQEDPNFQDWARIQRELFWFDHSVSFKGLFNAEYIPYIYKLIGCSQVDLQNVHQLTQNSTWVRRVQKGELNSEDAKLAERAWLMTSLIRGRFYECLAVNENLHLINHPYKMYAGSKLEAAESFEIFNSEEYLIKMIIGSAFLENTPVRRVQTWAENIEKARKAISLGAIALPKSALESDAENRAAEAAKIIGIKSLSKPMHHVLEGIVSIGLGSLLSLTISPWGLLAGPAIQLAYRQWSGQSISEDLSSKLISNSARFKHLGKLVPSRIESTVFLQQQGKQ